MAAAPDEKARAEAWRAVHADERVGREVRAFGTVIEQRFGKEGVRAMLRVGGKPGAVTALSVKADQRLELDRAADPTAAMKLGEGASVSLVHRQAENERQGQRRGLRM